MRYAVPVEDFLLLLSTDAVVFVEEVEESTLGLLERSIVASLQVTKIGEDAFLKLFGVFHRSAKGLKAECETPDYVCARDMEKVVPDDELIGCYVWVKSTVEPRTKEHKKHIRQLAARSDECTDQATSRLALRSRSI